MAKPNADKLHDDLKAEYLMLQSQYEAFDQRALTIKGFAGPLLTGGIGLGFSNGSFFLVLAVTVLTLSMWWMEVLWKSFQYSLIDRIDLLEGWFRGEGPDDIAPLQVYAAWRKSYFPTYKKTKARLRIALVRFVYLPYLPISIFGLAAIVLIAAGVKG